MAEEPEARHVGGGVDADLEGGVPGPLVEGGHEPDGLRQQGRRRLVPLEGGGDDPEPERLRQHEGVAGPGAGVGQHGPGVDGAHHGQAVLGLGVVDRVAADDEGAGAAGGGGAAVEGPGQQFEGEALPRPGHEVEGHDRRRPHGVDVGEGVGGGDPSEVVGVVDDGGEEVGGEDDGEVVADPVDGGVVGGVEPDEEVGVGRRVEPPDEAEHGPQLRRRELAGAAGAVGEAGEADRFLGDGRGLEHGKGW